MPTRSNTAEGGSQGTTVTQGSGGNSGGASGDFWDLVSNPANGTFTFDGTWPAEGVLGYKIVRPTDTHFPALARWTFTNETEFYGRIYVAFPSSTWPSTHRMFMVASSGGARLAEVNLNSSGQIRVLNSANGLIATSTGALAANTLYRIEFHFLGNATTGRMETKYFVGHSTTSVQDLAIGTDANTSGDAGIFDIGSGSANVTDGFVWHFDAVKLVPAAGGWIGPASGPMFAPAGEYPPRHFGPF